MWILACIVVGGVAGLMFGRVILAKRVVLELELGMIGAVLAYDIFATFGAGDGAALSVRGVVIESAGAIVALGLYQAIDRRRVFGSGVRRALRYARAAATVRRPRPVRHGNA